MLRARGARSLGPPPIALSTPARTPTPTRATDVERISEATPAPGRSGASSSDQSGDGGQVQKRMPGPSVKLASIVLGLALVVVVGGLLAQGFAGPSAPTPAPANVATAKGSPLKAIPARSDLAPLIADGEPPDDIVNAVVLPAGSLPGTVINNTNSAESYDEQRLFTLTSSQSDIIKFFEIDLPAQGWHVESTGLAKDQPGFEVLAQRAGSDGFYWEIGTVVTPTVFTASGPGAKDGLTHFEIRLFQVSDST